MMLELTFFQTESAPQMGAFFLPLAPQGERLHEVKSSEYTFQKVFLGVPSMSYTIIRIQKFKAEAVKGIQIHNRREKESRTNPDIDKSRTSQNYCLVECYDFKKAIEKRLATLNTGKTIRKDAVVMVQVLVTSGPEFFENKSRQEQEDFFKSSLEFIQKRYGKDNIISAVVHMDEHTPHMHIDLTPIRNQRLTAKTIFNREELRSLQSDFAFEVGLDFGLKRGEIKEEKRRHLKTEEFKIKAKEQELDERRKILDDKLNIEKYFPIITPEEIEALPIKKTFLLTYFEDKKAIADRLNKKFEKFKSITDVVVQLKKELIEARKKISELEFNKKLMEENIQGLKEHILIYEKGLSEKQRNEVLDKVKSLQYENEWKREHSRSRGYSR